VVTRQLQVERMTEKARRLKTDVLPLCHATNWTARSSRSGCRKQNTTTRRQHIPHSVAR